MFWVSFLTSFGQVTISSNEVWDNLTYVNTNFPGWENGITIQGGNTLTIDGITLNFNNNVYLTLNQQSHLIIQNSALLTSQSGFTWNGIYAEGDLSLNNYTMEPSVIPPNIVQFWSGVKNSNQTSVIIENSTIENATNGLLVAKGAIVEAENSTFLNCENGYECNNIGSNAYGKSYASHFMDCEFLWDDNFMFYEIKGLNLISLFGINIGGCKFINSSSNQFCLDERGYGIYSESSGFFVGESGNSDCTDDIGCPANCYNSVLGNGCEFNNLSYGIWYDFGYPQKYSFLCRRSTFSNNFTAIKSYETENTKIYKNTFSADRTTLNNLFLTTGCFENYSSSTIIKFIEFEDGETFEAYDNTFNFTGQDIYYIHSLGNSIPNLSYKQRIQKNTFNNSNPQTINSNNVIGIYAEGNTPNMGIFCNTFNNMGVDIEVSAFGSVKTPMLNNGDNPANSFSTVLANRFRIRNYGPNINYNYIGMPGNIKDPIMTVRSIGVTANNLGNEGNCSLSCTDFQTGVKHTEIVNTFKLYPNPSNSEINIEGIKLIESIILVNQLGQVVYNNLNINEFNFNHNISEFSNGIYYLIVNNNEKHVFIKN